MAATKTSSFLLASLLVSVFSCSKVAFAASFPLEELVSSIKDGPPGNHLFHLLPKEQIDNVRRFREYEIMAMEEVTETVYKFAPGFEGIKLVKLKPLDRVKFQRRDNNFYWRLKYDWGWAALTLGMIGLVIFVILFAWTYPLLRPAIIPPEPIDERGWFNKML